MKKIIVTFFLFVLSISNGQKLNDWQVGFNLNPFAFSRINTSNYEKDKQDFPNGFSYGLTIEKNWNDQFGFKTGFEISKQNIKYFEKNDADFNTNITGSFEYYKAPISLQYYFPLKEKLFLTFNQGIQFSFLKYLKIVRDQRYLLQIFTSDYYQVINDIDPSQNQLTYQRQNSYNESLFGIIGSIGLKGFISDKISYSTNLRYEYDISDSDKNLFYKGISTKPIHNFRFGLELGLQYHFSLNNYRFNKRPHKI